MRWFYCEDCGEVFPADEAATAYESHSELAGELGETVDKFNACPWCKSTELGDAVLCKSCRRYHKPTNSRLCETCETASVKGFWKLVEGLAEGDVEEAGAAIQDYLVDQWT